MGRGFILTLDVMIAIVLAAVLSSLILSLSMNQGISVEGFLYSLGNDFLAVGDKEGSLSDALSGSPERLNSLVDSMPGNICVNVSVIEQGGSVTYSKWTDCDYPGEYVVAKRTIVDSGGYHMASIRVWYR
jgi:hypothetical protein